MTLKIDFNNPRILKGHLEQALPLLGLEDVEDRILVGKEGGLAYALFKNANDFPLNFRISSEEQRVNVEEYLEAVTRYIGEATVHASDNGAFILVTNSPKGIIVRNKPDSFFYNKGIGEIRVYSPKRLEHFLEMIKSGKEDLDKTYSNLVELAKPFKNKK